MQSNVWLNEWMNEWNIKRRWKWLRGCATLFYISLSILDWYWIDCEIILVQHLQELWSLPGSHSLSFKNKQFLEKPLNVYDKLTPIICMITSKENRHVEWLLRENNRHIGWHFPRNYLLKWNNHIHSLYQWTLIKITPSNRDLFTTAWLRLFPCRPWICQSNPMVEDGKTEQTG